MYTLANPSFTIQKWDLKGSKLRISLLTRCILYVFTIQSAVSQYPLRTFYHLQNLLTVSVLFPNNVY